MDLEQRILALEQRLDALERNHKEVIDRYRSIQVDDENNIRYLYHAVMNLKALVEALQNR